MIIVKLMGGLGNQLFQYATGKALALKHKTDLKLDLSLLNEDPKNKYTKRKLELDLFFTNYVIATDKEVKLFTQKNVLQKIFKKYTQLDLSKYTIANQNGFEFNTNFLTYPKNTYLNGYWQSEKFFSDIRAVLLKELVIKKPLSEDCKIAQNHILNSNSVSLHIRRGDYVSDKNAEAFHGILSLEYYHNAINYLNTQVDNIEVFVFSDDMDWVKSNLKLKNKCNYIDFNKNENSVFDMYLMSICKHHIIANSSFSWWGAWLNNKADKIVIAPKIWFADKEKNEQTQDNIPPSWIRF